jgi:hypothetical protein
VSSVHRFELPDAATTSALDRDGLTWAYCNDTAKRIEDATTIFHPGSVPLDPGGRRQKCMMCGARLDDGGAS